MMNRTQAVAFSLPLIIILYILGVLAINKEDIKGILDSIAFISIIFLG